MRKRSRVRFRPALARRSGCAASLRPFRHSACRFPPPTPDRSKRKWKFVPGGEHEADARGPNKIRGNTRHSDGEFWRCEVNIEYNFGRTPMNEKLNIFVSSVQKELEDERVIVQNLLNTDPF